MIVERILAHRLPHNAPIVSGSRASATRPGPVLPKAKVPPLDGLLIEVGGVVYDDTCWWRWLAQVLSHAGIHTRYDTLLEDWEAEFLRHADSDDAAFWRALRRCLAQLGLAQGFCDEIQAAATAQRKTLEASLHAFPGISCALEGLARRCTAVVAVADCVCPGPQLTARLRSLFLSAPFQAMVSAGDSRQSLADPAFYGQLLAGLKLDHESMALVSHKERHLAAASAAGLATIAIGCSKDVRADIHFDRLASVLIPPRSVRAPRVAA